MIKISDFQFSFIEGVLYDMGRKDKQATVCFISMQRYSDIC